MSEATDQQALFALLEQAQGRYPILQYVFHVPNGEKRDKATAAKLKRMGVKSGVPDVLLPLLRYDDTGNVWWSGLAIEMKTAEGTEQTAQKQWAAHLAQQGWRTEICREWTAAARLILEWVGARPDEWGV